MTHQINDAVKISMLITISQNRKGCIIKQGNQTKLGFRLNSLQKASYLKQNQNCNCNPAASQSLTEIKLIFIRLIDWLHAFGINGIETAN